MRHLVTGGSGFLGNLIARRLRDRGEVVRILDIWGDETRPAGIEYVACDIRDRHGVAAAMKGIDVVHHNAALVPLTKSGSRFWEVNVDGSRIAAEEAVNARVQCFIHMSSSAIFGIPGTCPITNATQPRPAEIYGRCKLAGELAVKDTCAKAGVPLIVIRPRTILGQGRLGIFQMLFEWIREGRSIYIIGNGSQLFQFVHATDLMDAYMLALDLCKPGEYNVGTDRFGTLREALEHLIAHAGTQSGVRRLPEGITINTLQILDFLGLSPLAPWHYLTYHKAFFFDVQPLLRLGWKPQYSNDEMLREAYDWFREHLDWLKQERKGSPHRRPVKESLLGLLRKLS